jgi:hypothetical protein
MNLHTSGCIRRVSSMNNPRSGVIVVFALSGSKQHDRQHYADVAADSQPLAAMRRTVSVVGLSALSSSETLPGADLCAAW